MYDLCIIGFGVSGIAVMRQAKKHNINVIALEKNSNLGGCWWEKSYPDVKLQSNKKTYSYSDWTYNDFVKQYPDRDEILDYLTQYCNHFKLFENVQFNSCVSKTKHNQQKNAWEIEYTQEGKEFKIVSTFLCVCSGIYSKPHIPNFKNMNLYQGDIYHSSEWSYTGTKTVNDFKDKKIIVIGNGSSGCDMACLALKNGAKSVSIVYKTNKWIFNRDNKLFNVDILLNRLFMLIGKKLTEQQIKFILKLYCTVYLLVYKIVKGSNFSQIEYPDKSISRNNVVLNDDFYRLIGQNKLKYLHGTISQFKKNTIEFSINNCLVDYNPDLVIMATGYDKSVPFLNLKEPPVYLYNRILHPKFMSLAFIGFIMTVFWIQTSELQAKWFINYIKGIIKTPTKQEIVNYLLLEKIYYDKHNSQDRYDYAFRSFDYCYMIAGQLNIDYSTKSSKVNYWLKPLYHNEWFS